MPNYSNLEQTIEEILFNYGGVLQKLAEIQKEVYEQIEALKNAGVKIRRANKTYSPGTVLTCIGSGNGSKFLFTQNGGTTGEDFKDESWYNSLIVGQTYIDGGVIWEVLEDAYTKHSIVESALNASHASTADVADYASSAGSALQAAYVGPFQVVNLGTATSSGSESSGGPIVTSTGINYEVIDTTRNWASARAGNIVNGEYTIPVPYVSGFLPNGRTLYLQGSSSDGQTGSFNFGYIPPQEISENEFLTALAHNSGGKVQQIQFGDIVTPWPGKDQEIYVGPFKVEPNGEITQDNTVPIRIIDPTAPKDQVTGKYEWAGKVFAGESYRTVNISSGNLNNGDYIYLMGDSKNGSVDFHYVAYIPQVTSDGSASDGKRTITSAGFYVRLAKNEGGKIIQIQHGDITVPPWKVTYADSAGYAERANFDYNGPFKVSVTGTTEGTNSVQVSITDPTDYSTNPPKAGRIFDGETLYTLTSATLNPLDDGAFVYLKGTTGSNPYFSLEAGNNNTSQFCIRIAQNVGGIIRQIQYGDVFSIPWNAETVTYATNAGNAQHAIEATTASEAGYALEAGYVGPFQVVITGTTEGTNTVNVKVIDPTDPRSEGHEIAGKVFDGETLWEVGSSSINEITDGAFVYLNGGTGWTPIISDDASNNDLTNFSIRIAQNIGGKIRQLQYGDVYSIPYNANTAITATTASMADYASSAGYSEYHGPFQVSITGITEGTNTVTVKVIDPNDTSTPQRAGYVFDGSSVIPVVSSSVQITDGAFVYLNGTTGSVPVIENIAGNNNTSQYSIRLAKNSGGKIIQMQFGDVYSIPWNVLNAQVAISAYTASEAAYADKAGYIEYYGPFHVSGTYDDIQEAFTGVSVKDDTRTGNVGGYVVIGSTNYPITSRTGIRLNDGYKLFLKLTDNGNGGYTFNYISSNTQPTPATGEFITQLAYNNGGKLIQTQFGDIVQPSTGVTKISVTGGSVNPASGIGEVEIIIPGNTSGTSDIKTYVYEQPHEIDATSVSDAVINVEPNTHILFAISHNLKEISNTKYFRYYWTGDEPSGQYQRTRHLTDYNDPYDPSVVAGGYGAEFHLIEPEENCTIIISNFDKSVCILSADNPIINNYSETFIYPDFIPLYEDTSYILTFVSGSTSFWYMNEY